MPSQDKHVSTGSAYLGSVYIQATSQCRAGFQGVEADLERLKDIVASTISRGNHNLSCGTCNMPLTMHQDKAQCNAKRHAGWQSTPSICRMKVESRVQFQMQGHQKLPISSADVIECLLSRQSNPQQPTPPVGPNNVWPVTQGLGKRVSRTPATPRHPERCFF